MAASEDRVKTAELTAFAPAVFAGIPEAELSNAFARLHRRTFSIGDVLITEGEQPAAIFLIQRGHAEILVADRDGIEHVVSRVGPGTLVGEMSLLTGQAASGTVSATSEIEAIVVEADEFERLLVAFPRIYRNLGAMLAGRLAKANRRVAGDLAGRVAVLRSV